MIQRVSPQQQAQNSKVLPGGKPNARGARGLAVACLLNGARG
jgi:hypothetical protein